jgi:hypothetical protein
LERGGKIADAVIDREAPEPGQAPRAGTDSVQGEVTCRHARVDAQRDEAHRHDVVHDDVRAQNDREVFVRERQDQE